MLLCHFGGDFFQGRTLEPMCFDPIGAINKPAASLADRQMGPRQQPNMYSGNQGRYSW